MQLLNRLYYYWVDLQGRLYCIDEFQTKMPFGPTHIKDPKFLNFFFRQVKPNPDPLTRSTWPYVSPCGKEMNFIKPEDRPIVYHSIKWEEKKPVLHYAHDLKTPFVPENVRVTATEGRFYHPAPVGGYGLLRSALALDLGEAIKEERGHFFLHWNNTRIPIQTITEEERQDIS
eukprot:TRINITY_DN5942_c0_g1_i1.p1 TRINITY_DN5942_c0_g1~~TRINITY_DN5942_c0_g1_i1.p1  ORF type:complete len:173 (+),score=45.60 TRINITY_DN5942_c0_g1_i1:42-560(+)